MRTQIVSKSGVCLTVDRMPSDIQAGDLITVHRPHKSKRSRKLALLPMLAFIPFALWYVLDIILTGMELHHAWLLFISLPLVLLLEYVVEGLEKSDS